MPALLPVSTPDLLGPIPTLWHADGIRLAWKEGRDLVERALPPVVQLHTWEPYAVAEDVRRALVGVQLVVGVGIDGIARDVLGGRKTLDAGIATFRELALRAERVGALAIVWNAEAAYKAPPRSPEASTLRALVRAGLASAFDAVPHLRQWHTAYDHPTYHSGYCWNAFLGEDSPVERSLPQVYGAPGGGFMAHRGALARREARALGSWQEAVRQGWITPDDPATPMREGVGWSPYYQLHHVPAPDTVASAMQHDRAALWALPSRSDEAGREAFQALCAIFRARLWGDVVGLQRFLGVADDGLYGPLTHAATLEALVRDPRTVTAR